VSRGWLYFSPLPHYLLGVISGDRVRLKLTLQYDGSGFHGWQVQNDERTVQGEIEAALERLTGAQRPVIGSGRTDRGVHATGQVASVDVPPRWSAPELQRALNAVLPDDIWIQDVRPVALHFHPRYDAVARTYTYRLGIAPESRSPFHRGWCWALTRQVRADLLAKAAQQLQGDHSFEAFAKAGQPERGYRCVVLKAAWEPWRPLGHAFRITANRYLHHMVRYLVGTMVGIATGRRPSEDMALLLSGASHDLETSPPAPPEGLFLTRVRYPESVLDPDHEPEETARPTHGDPTHDEDLP
jgi:tRNA pseudouridine38-40 synthase